MKDIRYFSVFLKVLLNLSFSEISKAQDRLTDLLQNVYKRYPQYREISRLILSTVGRGGEGDVGQRIRDEILVIQVTFFIMEVGNIVKIFIIHI